MSLLLFENKCLNFLLLISNIVNINGYQNLFGVLNNFYET